MRLSACLVALGLVLAVPVLAQVKVPSTVAVVPPPLSTVPVNRSGCSPYNPCAISTPALGAVSIPTPEEPPQPERSGETAAAAAPAPAAQAPAGAGRGAQAADCPAPGARGGFGRGQGRGQFAGRGGEGQGQNQGQNQAQDQGRGAGRGQFAGRAGRGLPPNCLPQGANPGAGRGNAAIPRPGGERPTGPLADRPRR